MTAATTVPFSGLVVLLESTTTANTFVAPCGLKERALTLTKETGETVVPDCDDEDAAPFVERDLVSRSANISGSGVMARQSIARWRAAYDSNDPVKVRVQLAGNLAAGGGYWTGLFHLTSFKLGAMWKEKCTVEVEMESTGTVLWTAAAA